MKNILIVILLVYATFFAYKKFTMGPEPLYEDAYIAVYGRSSCGLTNKMRSELDRSNTSYRYFDIDDPHIAAAIHERMEQTGLSTRSYMLPVIDVNGSISTNPEPDAVIATFKSGI